MMPHTLPSEMDRGNVKPHPEGRAWTLDDMTERIPLDPALAWNEDGVHIERGLIDDDLIERYKAEWIENNGPVHWDHPDGSIDAKHLGGYYETAYMKHAVLAELVCDARIAAVNEMLIGEPAGINLLLSGWVSTMRSWHQDRYLQDERIGDHYLACWICLDDVAETSGPFQYIKSSHLWPDVLTQRAMDAVVTLSDPRWPAHSEQALEPIIQKMVDGGDAEVVTYLPKRGDVLWWHSREWHQGSKATIQNSYRGALIAHYSGIHHRPDFPYPAIQHPRWGGWMFPYPSHTAFADGVL